MLHPIRLECSLLKVVWSRAIEGEVADQDVYCRFGLKWSDEARDFVADPDGCTAIIKYGAIKPHESICEYALLPCPNSDQHTCGLYRRRSLQKHLNQCRHVKCPNNSKGCTFMGSHARVVQHNAVCEHGSLQPGMENENKLIAGLVTSHIALEDKVDELSQRIEQLEETKLSQSAQLEMNAKLLQQLSAKVDELSDWLQKLMQAATMRDNGASYRPRSQCFEGSPPGSVLPFSNGLQRKTSSTGSMLTGISRTESWEMPFQFKCIGTLRSHKGGVWCLQTYKKRVFSCGVDCNIKVWDLDDLVHGCKQSFVAHTQRIHTMAVNSHHLYSAGEDLAIKSWRLHDLSLHEQIEDAHEQMVAALICTEDLLISSSYMMIKVWHGLTLSPLQSISELHHWVRSLTLSPTMDKLYSGSHGTIDVWNMKTEKLSLVGKISHTHGSVYSLAVTTQYIIAGTYNQNLHVFDVNTRQYLQYLMGHVGIINCIATSPSGRFMFSASSDSTVMVWSLEKMLPIQTLQRHNDSVNTLMVNGDLLLTGSEDTEIKVFKYFRMMGFVSS